MKHTHSKGSEDGLLLYQRPYTGVGNLPETPEFIIRVKIEDYNRWIKDPHSVALVEVVDAWEVFVTKTSRAHSGTLERPSRQELEETFGTSDFETIFKFMVENGHIQHAGHQTTLEGHEKG
eukprot:gene4980-5468_t